MYKICKRAFDFICALIGIIGTSPIWVFSIVATLISDFGPLHCPMGRFQVSDAFGSF